MPMRTEHAVASHFPFCLGRFLGCFGFSLHCAN
jgi:hypothetical protein